MNLLFNLHLRDMKKIFMCACCLATLLTACNNDVVEQLQSESELKTKSVVETDTTDVIIMTDEVWKEMLSSHGEFSEYNNPSIGARGYVDTRTAQGSHSCVPRIGMENLKVRFSTSQSEQMGLPAAGIYITDYCEAKINLYTGEGEEFYYVADSPNCGFKPDGNGSRGYAMSIDGNKVVLTTYLTHVKYDFSGRNIDIWWPTSPDAIIWDYKIYIPNWN